jgi:hypothetical protein
LKYNTLPTLRGEKKPSYLGNAGYTCQYFVDTCVIKILTGMSLNVMVRLGELKL